MGGYVHCECRDCFEIAITGDDPSERALCHACEEAGCEPGEECQAPHTYCPGDGGYGEDVAGNCTVCGEAF